MTPWAQLKAAARSLDVQVGAGLLVLGFFSLALTEKEVGFTRDESVYFFAAENHARWFQLLVHSPAAAFERRGRSPDLRLQPRAPGADEEPVRALVRALPREARAGCGRRRPSGCRRSLVAAMILPLIFALRRRLFGRPAAVLRGALVLPRAAAVLRRAPGLLRRADRRDVAARSSTASGARRRRRGGGSTPASPSASRWRTKHNALFLPFVLIPFALGAGLAAVDGQARGARAVRQRQWASSSRWRCSTRCSSWRWAPERSRRSSSSLSPHDGALRACSPSAAAGCSGGCRPADEATFRAVAPLVAMAVLGPVIFYLHWPYLWHAPGGPHRLVPGLPRHPQQLHLVLPGRAAARAALPARLRGGGDGAHRADRALRADGARASSEVALLARRASGRCDAARGAGAGQRGLASIAIISQPEVPHFGGVKHWFPSMPFLAMLAGRLGVRARRRRAHSGCRPA